MTSKNNKPAAAFEIAEELPVEATRPEVWESSDVWTVLVEHIANSTWKAQKQTGEFGIVRIPEFRRQQVDGCAFQFHWEPSPTDPTRGVFVIDKKARLA